MRILDLILNYYKHKADKGLTQEKFDNLLGISLSSIFMLFFFISHIIAGLFLQEYLFSCILGFASLLIYINYRLLLSRHLMKFTGNFLLIISMLIILLFSSYESAITGSYWILIFPALTVGIKNLKNGSLYTITFLIIIITVLILSQYISYIKPYSLGESIKLIGSYILVYLFIYAFEQKKELMYQRLEQQLVENNNEIKNKDEFLSRLSHQIRTPLNNITLISTLVNQAKFDPEQRDLFETIIASTNNLVNVVNNIVKVSTIELEQELTSNINYNLHSTIENTIKLFENQHEKGIQIKLTNQVKQNFLGDPVRIKQLFLTIIENVIKNSGPEERINIEIDIAEEKSEHHNSTIRFKIISPAYKLIEFENNFYLLDITEDFKPERSDIAYMQYDFSIAEKIISLHKGSIEFDLPDSLFSFTLKLVNSPSQPLKQTAEKEILKQKTAKALNEANILLVEDNAINQKIVLLSLKGKVRNIDLANNGKEALDKFGSAQYDVILMDIQMPVMNGLVATKKIRELESTTNINTPIIAITANALSGDKEACLAAGMNDYISKPFQVEVLLKKMEGLLKNENAKPF